MHLQLRVNGNIISCLNYEALKRKKENLDSLFLEYCIRCWDSTIQNQHDEFLVETFKIY